MNITIRDERNEDVEAIEKLTKAAFENAEHTSHTEHFIMSSLRNHRQLTISLVAIEDGSKDVFYWVNRIITADLVLKIILS
ncbi:putative N-acetyltransferase YhbS [Acinetobacter calcoaceticus]|nr:putative N-acetyltransferase YhbS [Acinetobacter calcoaceticus]